MSQFEKEKWSKFMQLRYEGQNSGDYPISYRRHPETFESKLSKALGVTARKQKRFGSQTRQFSAHINCK
ncbi:hypothetical protein [Okeania sp. SIO1I7]|uniref:hypothetical protein n=1 Tax=Okeania sp. SIO1I7 TaxID=2607772 RepID=UPI0013F73B06|nr:hypothetical protein [Okeania sp. SIO1I7]NET30042.1 hypothetical protein [Okeania sp. SIO1I7]